jgi:hypothetical protein
MKNGKNVSGRGRRLHPGGTYRNPEFVGFSQSILYDRYTVPSALACSSAVAMFSIANTVTNVGPKGQHLRRTSILISGT